jgi:signal transduction histidine kinase
VRNALHSTDHGFVRLVVRRGGFSVIDSGVGIPADQRARMFRPFARGDASRGDGIGIGLSLVQRICDSQGWTIRLNERAGGGCDFRVDFRTS